MMLNAIRIVATATLLASASFAANAATYTGATLAGGAGGIGLVGGGDGAIYVTGNGAYDNTPTTPASDWVWALPQSATDGTVLHFVFHFVLSAGEVANATLSGLWGVDNDGVVQLNGNLLDSITYPASGFNPLRALSTNSGFAVGDNYLTFDVNNYIDVNQFPQNPAAFRASITVLASVPLPAALPLLGGALAAFGFAASRRKRST
jgi:hypothetical protein